ncbi:MAG: GNAT family N-acetyltransferase [Colwelliaceae bacterium]|nr:GNAT family N-acetyltransferase [Colwelliaceae bacterium]
MNKPISFRTLQKADLASAKIIIDETEMFPSELLDDMVTPFFSEDDSQEIWFVAHTDKPIGIAYCMPEKMTDGTWNLLLIAVHPNFQGKGVGKQFIAFIEQQIKNIKGRILLVETSSLPEYELTRKFYPQCNYTQVACIPDYYEKGDDKITFWKQIRQ